nr:glycoside hydrolase [Bacteroides intestinalis]
MKKLVITTILSIICYVTFAQSASHFEICPEQPLQVMEHFSASDAWSMHIIGKWPQEKQNQVADWLFSTENDANGKPMGIGLSLWRFNVGAGSTEQGEASQIGSPWMRTECFLQPDGSYNWNKQQGQRNFLRLAKERGVNKFLAFLNSPPVYFTQNGLATNTGRDGTLNLKEEHYEDFAHFLANVIKGVEEKDGIKFDYLSPFNEPDGHWNWIGPKQEGTPATKKEIARAVRLISKEFVKEDIDTEITICESSDYRCMFSTHMTNHERGYEIQSFFSPDSVDTYLGNTPNVSRLIAGHSYWTNTPLNSLRNYRRQLRDTLDKYKVDFWQTETCIMGNDEEIGGGGGFDRTMKTALYVARIIHHDIVYAGARSWQWWRAIGGDYKDGLIREYTNPDLQDGRVEDSKLMWILGNYSRFIRPGAVRMTIAATDKSGQIVPEGDTDQKGLMCSAYRNTNGQWVMVIINYADQEQECTFRVNDPKVKSWQGYRTSDTPGEDLLPIKKLNKRQPAVIPARSVTTFVSEN